MCAILDNSVRDIVFGANPPKAARAFRRWIEKDRRIRLVVGGHLKKELSGKQSVKEWLSEGESQGFVQLVDDKEVNTEAARLKNGALCESNDQHVIALARVSGARLLYTDDRTLERDFHNGRLISRPGGTIYPKGNIKGGHRRWLHEHRNICG